MEDSRVLYTKYRPKTFAQVLGQEHIVAALKGAIEKDRVAHAYIFAGPRGTGKTTMARIFARELGVSDRDIYEIDAATYTKVDDIRELQDGVRTLPFESAKKVYIIDEVHMLSKSAFNAFLKTLEEPPAHVIFILATTELHKVIETVISRCQIFYFKKPSHQMLRKMVSATAKKEGYDIEDSAADLVALLGDGSFRDTHGTLQKVMAGISGKSIKLADVELATGAPRSTVVRGVISAILDKDIGKALSASREAADGNVDIRLFIKMIVHGFRVILLLRFAPDMKADLDRELSDDDMKFYAEMSAHKNAVGLSVVLRELLSAYEETRWSYIGELPLELALTRLIRPGE